MNLLMISLLLFSAALHIESSNTNVLSKPWQYNTRKVNDQPDDYEHCICFPSGPLPTVDKLLDSNNQVLERVVIYLYKNILTNEIKIYTPNSDKQELIPDLPYESGDELVKLSTENIYQLLYNSINRIKVYNDFHHNVNPAVTESLPIGLNVGEIEVIYPIEDNFTPNNNYDEYSPNLPNNVIAVVPDAYRPHTEINNLFPEWTKLPNNVLVGHTNLVASEQYWTTDTMNNPIQAQANPLYFKAFPGNQEVFPLSPQAYPIDSNVDLNHQATPNNDPYVGGLDQDVVYTFPTNQEPTKSSSATHVHLSTKYETFTFWFEEQMKRFQNVHLPTDIKTIDSVVLKILVKNTLFENHILINTYGQLTDSTGAVIDASNLELRPLLVGEKFDHQILQNLHRKIVLPKDHPFLEGILVTLVSPPQILGIIPLGKTSITATKREHSLPGLGMTQANVKAVFVNRDENVPFSTSAQGFDYTNVKATLSEPVKIIAEPISYHSGDHEEMGAGNVYHKSSIDKVPAAYPYEIANKDPKADTKGAVRYWSDGAQATLSNERFASSNPSSLPLEKTRKLTDVKIEHYYDPPVKITKKLEDQSEESKKVEGNISNEGTTAESLVDENPTESGTGFPLTGVMRSLLTLLAPSPKGHNSTNDADITNESENGNGGGGPDFRIIGGTAATGSGTPLSNKGRSGHNKYI